MKSSFAFCLFLGLVSAAGLAAGGCSDDETGEGTGGSGNTGASGSSGTPGSGGSGASSSSSGSGGEGATGGEGGRGTGGEGGGEGGGGGGGNAQAAAFCAEYSTVCGFGANNHFDSEDDCLTSYVDTLASDPGEIDCWEQHIGFVDGMESVHCEHAAGVNCP